MFYIRADENGLIDAFGAPPLSGGTLFEGELPSDFCQWASSGKYLLIDGNIEAADGWEAPETPEED